MSAAEPPRYIDDETDLITLECGVDPLCEWHVDNVPERIGRTEQRKHEHRAHPVGIPPDVPASASWASWRPPQIEAD